MSKLCNLFIKFVTLYCPWVHANELRIFVPPLRLRAVALTIINSCFDPPLACRNQLHNEGVGTKYHLSNKI